MSHIKNVDAYSRLVSLCTGYGGKYNPGQQNLKLKAMRALLDQAQSSLQDVKQTKTDYNNATNEREILFDEMLKRVTPVVNLLKSSGASALTVKDAYGYARLIKGKLAKSRPPVPSTESDEAQENPEKSVRQRSFTQQSYVSKTGHFGWLVKTLESQAIYQPNEPELQVDSLKMLLAKAQEANSKVATTYQAWARARMERNRILYTADEALYGNARAVKDYVSAIYGTQSEAYRQLTRIRFTKHVS